MAYIGNKADTAFTSLLKQDLTGASGTSLTLTHAVANANDIALYINNVRQEPATAYSTNGTAVSLTGSVVSSDDIYVIYLARAVQTTVPPDGSVSTAKIADSAVSTAKIASSAVDLTSKVTGVLPTANGGSAIDIIANSTTVVSGAANIEIPLSTDTNYIMQQIVLFDVLSSANQDMYLYLRTTGGAFRESSNEYEWVLMERKNGVDTNGTGSNGDSKIRLNWYSVGTTSDEKCIFTLNFFHASSTNRTTVGWNGIGTASDGHPVVREGSGKVLVDESNDRIRLKMNGANISAGGYVHYGYRRT